MVTTEFYSPSTLVAALELLDQYKRQAVIVNGGTDIVERIANGTIDPAAIIYIQRVAELKEIRESDGVVRIGGAVTYEEVLDSPLSSQFSALKQAVLEVGSPAIRVVGTPAGNIGTAVPAGDCSVALMALDAEVVAASKQGERVIKLADFVVDYRKTSLAANELIKEIRIPVIPGVNTASAFVKLANRKAQDIAQASAAVRLTVEGDVCRDIVVAMGSINKVTVRARSLEKIIAGKRVADAADAIKSIVPAEVALGGPGNELFAARPTAEAEREYKEAVIGVVVERAIKKAYAEVLGRRN
ncbi:MAG: FAD binding domain-containing protein [Candidatus Korobacteraceae bacterium]